MKTWTLRTRLTFWSALTTTLTLLGFGFAIAVVFYLRQVHALDHQLTVDSQVFFLSLDKRGELGSDEAEDAAPMLKGSARILGYAFGRAGQPASHQYPRARAALFAAWPKNPAMTTVNYNGSYARLAVFRDKDHWLILASDLHSTVKLTSQALGAYLLSLPVVLLVIFLGNDRIVRLALLPVTEMTRAVTSITATRLDGRIPQPNVDDEIGRHIRVLNEMFDRLQRGFEQSTRFTADASHELRTPLTIIRGEIEQALRSGGFSQRSESVLLSVLEQVDHLQSITANLLLLASFDAGRTPVGRTPVDLETLAADAAETAGLLGAPKGVVVDVQVAAGLQVGGNAVLLRRCFLNLAENAVRYNRPGGRVLLDLHRDAATQRAVLAIANTGQRIPPECQHALFQRFFRVPANPHQARGGAGLGLSLCREILTAHGGEIKLAQSEIDWTEFVITLPLCEAGAETFRC